MYVNIHRRLDQVGDGYLHFIGKYNTLVWEPVNTCSSGILIGIVILQFSRTGRAIVTPAPAIPSYLGALRPVCYLVADRPLLVCQFSTVAFNIIIRKRCVREVIYCNNIIIIYYILYVYTPVRISRRGAAVGQQ